MSFTCVSAPYKAFLTKVVSEYIPQNVKEAMECDKWE